MIVQYIAPNGTLLLSRAQAAPPRTGERVIWDAASSVPHYYRVACVEWPLIPPAADLEFYSLSDAPQVVIRALLKEEL